MLFLLLEGVKQFINIMWTCIIISHKGAWMQAFSYDGPDSITTGYEQLGLVPELRLLSNI